MNKLSNMAKLVDKTKPYGEIRFIHFRDGKEHVFYSAVNSLTGDRMSAFDTEPPSVGDSLSWVKSVFRDIRTKATKVISYEGAKHFQ